MAYLTVNLLRYNLYRQVWSLKCMNLRAFFLNHFFSIWRSIDSAETKDDVVQSSHLLQLPNCN